MIHLLPHEQRRRVLVKKARGNFWIWLNEFYLTTPHLRSVYSDYVYETYDSIFLEHCRKCWKDHPQADKAFLLNIWKRWREVQ